MSFKKKTLVLVLAVINIFNVLPFAIASGEGNHKYESAWVRQAFLRSYNSAHNYEENQDSDIDSMGVVQNEFEFLDLSGLGLTELPDLSDFTSLKYLDISNNPIIDISSLNSNDRLLALAISNTYIEKLPSMPSLEILWAATPSLIDISAIGPKITKLLMINTSISDFSALDNLHNTVVNLVLGDENRDLDEHELLLLERNASSLQSICLTAASFDLPFLKECNSLSALHLYGLHSSVQAETLTAISGLSIQELELRDCNLKDIEFLRDMNRLMRIYLNKNEIKDLSPLSNKAEVKTISLNNNLIKDISPLATLNSLGALMLANNCISDIAPIKELQELLLLDLSNNNIMDAKPISCLRKPRAIIMDNNPIKTCQSFSGLSTLRWLSLRGVGIDTVKPLAKLKELIELDLTSNNIEDPTPLAKLSNLSHIFLFENPVVDVNTITNKMPNTHLGSLQDYARLKTTINYDDKQVQAAINRGVINSDGQILESYRLILENPTPLVDLDTMTYHKSLYINSIDLSFLELKELPNLGSFTSLNDLNLVGNSIDDFSQLSNVHIGKIAVDVSKPAQLAPLYSQTNFLKIEINALEGFVFSQEDYTWISNNDGLWRLDIDYPGDLDISMIKKLKNLFNLVISRALISDYSSLKSTSAEIIEFNGMSFDANFWKALSQNRKLDALLIHHALLGDFSGISKLSKISELTLDFCDVSDLSPLQKLTNLRYLGLQNNDINDITPILKLNKLISLNLTNNPVSINQEALNEISASITLINNSTR